MEAILARCGYRCDLCLAFRANVEADPLNQQRLSDGWFIYFGFRIPPEKIICDGCLSVGTPTIDQGCPVRPCAAEKGLASCADCAEYICPRLAERIVVFEDIRQKLGREIPAGDRVRFILPYENKERLDARRP